MANVITKLYAALDPRFSTGFKIEHQCRRGLYCNPTGRTILSNPAFLINLSRMRVGRFSGREISSDRRSVYLDFRQGLTFIVYSE